MKFAVSMLDLSSNLLFVYLTLTALAFQSMVDGTERALPPVSLAGADGAAVATGGTRSVTVSAKREGRDRARYFVDDTEIGWSELSATLKALKPSAVVLRIDEDLPMKAAIGIFALLKSVNITNVSIAYKAG